MAASITTFVLQYRGQPCWCSHFLPCAWGGVMRIRRQAVCKCSVYEDNDFLLYVIGLPLGYIGLHLYVVKWPVKVGSWRHYFKSGDFPVYNHSEICWLYKCDISISVLTEWVIFSAWRLSGDGWSMSLNNITIMLFLRAAWSIMALVTVLKPDIVIVGPSENHNFNSLKLIVWFFHNLWN